MLDSNLLLLKRTAALLVADSPLTGTGKLVGVSLAPETWLIHVPTVANTTTPVMTVLIQESDNDSDYYTIATRVITTPGEYYETVLSSRTYRRVYITITGTSADFGLVVVGRVPAGRYTNW
jgi:hypothetical protein